MFMQLPSRKLYPDYYAAIVEPMSLRMVKQKVDEEAVVSLEDFRKDMDLIFTNAKTYNEPGSEIFEDATFLQVRWVHLCGKLAGWLIRGLETVCKVHKVQLWTHAGASQKSCQRAGIRRS
jgi:hypothetical protein